MFLSLPVEVDCSDGAAVGITLKSNPPSAACTKKEIPKNIGRKNATKGQDKSHCLGKLYYVQ